MSHSSSDEFDNLGDLNFDDLDWGALDIPSLAGAVSECPLVGTAHADANESFDHDRGVDEREGEAASLPPVIPPRPSSALSSEYSCDEDVDEAFLVELDALERRIVDGSGGGNTAAASASATALPHQVPPPPHRPQPTARVPPLRSPLRHSLPPKKLADPSPRPATKRARSTSGGSSPPPKKGKMKAILESLEDEMTCPICCDLFVAAHLGNPCGHSFCGDCGSRWIKKNRTATCAICRTQLSRQAPMLPNIAMQSTVEKHIEVLAESGNEDWKPGGAKMREWSLRKQKWKREVVERERAKPKPAKTSRRTQRAVAIDLEADDLDDLASWLVPDDDFDEEYYD